MVQCYHIVIGAGCMAEAYEFQDTIVLLHCQIPMIETAESPGTTVRC